MTPTRLVALAAGFLVLAGGLGVALRRVAGEVATPVHLPDQGYATSQPCVLCHPARYETWHQTFHRTMTQRADTAAVLGDFENATYTYRGVTTRFTREGDRHFIETASFTGAPERYEVAMTVGSRRMQQYLTRVGDRHVRLPVAWNVEERRWIHLNGGFLDPDGVDFNHHRAEWDYNCIFCHNVKAQPRFDDATDTFDARVEELGIACEACHGPGDLHVARNQDPLRRYVLYLAGRDPTIHSPKELPRDRQIQICGHCHGQRTPNPPQRIAEFLMVGDPYTAGDDLSRIVTPLSVHTELPGVDVSLRFWKDGTPRLTAYEYQGLMLSDGHEDSDLTCISCHEMHGGDPRGMITAAKRGNLGCLQCHGEIGRDVAGHTKHEANGSGSDCYSCHMPHITYGLLTVHPSHRITNPEPSRAWRHDMPEACTMCHTDRTAAWAEREAARQFGRPAEAAPSRADFEVAESVRALFAGDVVQRAVAASALARERSYTTDDVARLWAVPLLLLATEDHYPAIRHFAWPALRGLTARAPRHEPGARAAARLEFDYLADAPARAAALDRAWRWWRSFDKRGVPHPGGAVPLDAALMPDRNVVAALRARQDTLSVSIGE